VPGQRLSRIRPLKRMSPSESLEESFDRACKIQQDRDPSY